MEPRAESARNRVSASCCVTAMVHSSAMNLLTLMALSRQSLHPCVRVVGETNSQCGHDVVLDNSFTGKVRSACDRHSDS